MVEENARLMNIIDKVDWSIITQAHEKMQGVLGEFQLSVDALLISIESDIK